VCGFVVAIHCALGKKYEHRNRITAGPEIRSTDLDGTDYSYARRRNSQMQKGGAMPVSYFAIGVLGVLAVIAAVKLAPDFIRYMKIRSM
jgi:hypothetical protein